MSATDNDTDDEDDDNNSKKKGFYDVDDDYSEKVLIISIVVGSIHFLRRGKKNILKLEGWRGKNDIRTNWNGLS